MSGFNEQEGIFAYSVDVMMDLAQRINKSIEEGLDKATTKEYLQHRCLSQITPHSPQLCVDHITNVYGLDDAKDDKERALRLIDFLGVFASSLALFLKLCL